MSKEWNAWYRKHREEYNQKSYQRQKRRRTELRAWLRSMKRVCCRCGFSNVVGLVFHHVDARTKCFTIGDATNSGWSRERILAEIAKCETVCLNCHAVEHAHIRGVAKR